MAVSLLVGGVVTFGPLLSISQEWLVSLGFAGEQSLKLLFAALIYDIAIAWGVLRILSGVGVIDLEHIALAQISTRCAEYLTQLDALPFTLTSSTNPFFFSGSSANNQLAKTAAYKMTDNVRLDAACRRYDSVNLIIDRVVGSITVNSVGVREAQQLAVRLGILGTFIGIVYALSQAGHVVHAGTLTSADVQNSINLIVRSLGVAFATSIAGLLASIFLQFMASILRSRETDLIELLEREAARVQAICRRASEDTPLGADIEALRETLGEHVQFMRRQEKDMIAISSRFGDALARTENTLAQPISALEQTGRRLSELLVAQGEAVTGLERMTTSVGNIETRVAAHFEASARQSAEVQKEALLKLAEVLRLYFDHLVEEVRTGWGRESREKFEGLVDHRLSEAVRQSEVAAGRQTRLLRRTSWLAGLLLLISTALLFVAVHNSGVLDWLWTHVKAD
ncbi:MAG: MotA/TolQ/ExbB proton channel family protein [Rhodopseudomonas palustris]|uniref:MotA/TolQ/ExbB proton channel family protein n=1 Tax=Rhodopseudomonas palustris TaxID=1076 RepID=A0A933W274_RHOPL|nr:MotA/TolQ/ExbB proton channel family protein [Rhodopseudomonas palustris]